MNEYLILYGAFFIGSFAGMGIFGSLAFWGLKKIMNVKAAAFSAIIIVLILVFWNLPPDTFVRLILYIPACVVFWRIWMGSKTIKKAASSVICNACNESNNPSFKQCWKCGTLLAGSTSNSGGTETYVTPSPVKASMAESSMALHKRIMGEQQKRLDIYEEELKKPYPAMTIEDAANYFFLQIDNRIFSFYGDKDFLRKVGIDKAKPTKLRDELFCFLTFAFDMAYHKVFGDASKAVVMRNLFAAWLKSSVTTTDNPNRGEEMYNHCMERTKEYFENFKAFSKTPNPMLSIGFIALCHIKEIPTTGDGLFNALQKGTISVDPVQSLAMDVYFGSTVEEFQKMLCNCKKLSCLSAEA